MAYLTPIVGNASENLTRAAHLSGVTTIESARLDTLCAQFNMVKYQMCFKGFKTDFLSHLTALGLRKTEDLTARLNVAVPNPKQAFAKGHPVDQIKGPMLLPYLVDYMWLLILEPVPPNRVIPYSQMYDPDRAGGASEPMLSAVKGGFRTLGVAFRGDTRSFQQFTAGGFVARFAVPPGDPFHVPEVYGTVAAKGMAFDRKANDFANQTGVCVARNIVGSMKFIGNAEKNITTGYMYALKFHTGVDTEQMQLDRQVGHGKSVLWRAGEKAAWEVPKWRFIASCRFGVDRPYSDNNRVFQYRRLSDWTFHWQGVSQIREYVLAATKDMPLNEWRTFGLTDDWAAE